MEKEVIKEKGWLLRLLSSFFLFTGVLLLHAEIVKADTVYVGTQEELVNAIENASGERTIGLKNNITLFENRVIYINNKAITVDGMGLYTIRNKMDNIPYLEEDFASQAGSSANAINMSRPIFSVGGGGHLVTRNINLDGSGSDSLCSTVYVDGTGTYEAGSGTSIYGGSTHGIFAWSSTTVVIDSGTNIYGNAKAGVATHGTLTINGGSIHNNGGAGVIIGIHANGTIGGNAAIYNNSGSGIFLYHDSTLTVNEASIYDNSNAGLEIYGDCYLRGGTIRNNKYGLYLGNGGGRDAGQGVVHQAGSVDIYSNTIGVDTYGIYNFHSGTIRNNGTGVYIQNGTVTLDEAGAVIRDSSSGAGIQIDAGTFNMSNGHVNGNNNGINVYGGSTTISGSANIHDNSGNGIYNPNSWVTVTITGGNIYGNSSDGVSNAGTIQMTGGSIRSNSQYGIANSGALNVSGGEIVDNTSHCIVNSSNGTVKLTGGTYRSGSNYNIWHAGAEGETGLVIAAGANGGANMSVYLDGFSRYITTGNDTHNFSIATNSYLRKKILVHTNSNSLAETEYGKVSISDSGHFTKRHNTDSSYQKDVVLWDRYTMTLKYRKFDINMNKWVQYGNDASVTKWAEETYQPQFGTPPQYYRNYAITETDPDTKAPADGAVVAAFSVGSDRTFYVCYYPDKYYVHFEGNGATGGTMADQTFQYGAAQKLTKNAFVRNFSITYNINGGTSSEKSSDSVSSDFLGWKISTGAINPSYSDQQSVRNLAGPGETRTLYAAWKDNAVTLPNASKADEYKVIDDEHKGWVKYYFMGWYTQPDGGQCVGRGGDAYIPTSTLTLYAHWSYKVCVYYDGNTNDGGGMAMDDSLKGDIKPYGLPYTIRENGYTKTGYDFFGWNTAQVDGAGNLIEDGKANFAPGSIYNEEIPLTLFAAWRTRFDIAYIGVCQTEGEDYFDNNEGADYSQLTGTVKLSESDDMKINTTKSFVDFETGEEVVENVTGTGVGWAFAKDIEAKYTEAYIADDTEYSTSDFFHMARDAGGLTYGSLSPDYQGTVPALNSSDMAVANMYRVWDYGPLIEGYDLYYTLEQAQSGYITEEELLSHAVAIDEELVTESNLRGEMEHGIDTERNTSFTVWDYSPTDFTSFTASGSVTETYLAIDSVGNQTKLMVTIHVTDTTPQKVLPVGTTRFISEKYYNAEKEAGGLDEDSLWKIEPDYVEVIREAFCNEENGTPEETYVFTHEDVQKMQEFIEENGIGNTQSDHALTQFYEQFMAPNKQ